jgi:hypothetical protein
MGVYKLSNPGTLTAPRTMYKSMLAGNPGFRISDYDLISTITLSTATQAVFSSIPQTYRHLQLRIVARSSSAVLSASSGMQFNEDGGPNYGFGSHFLKGIGSSVTSGNGGGTGYPTVNCFDIPGTSENSNIWGSGVVDILDYTSTTKNKVAKSLTGYDANGSGASAIRSILRTDSTAAISTINLNDGGGGGFIVGTRADLYGVME